MELLQRFANSELYSLGKNKRRLVVGGGIANCIPFNSINRNLVPETNKLSDAEQIASGIYKLSTGKYGYIVDLNKSIIRICPVRGNWSKYVEIFRLIEQPMDYRQISPSALELYVDNDKFRWSFLISDRGFKVYITLKPGYSGSNILRMGFRLNGLTRQGSKIYNDNDLVLSLRKPWLKDNAGVFRSVTEDISNEVLTLGANLDGLEYPVVIDPTLGPIGVDRDTHFRKSVPTEGSGQLTVTALNAHSVDITRSLYYFDISAIPSGATVVSSTFELWYQQKLAGNPFARQMDLLRMTVPDWEDRGTSTLGDEANWNNYKDPSVAWPGGAGALGDTDNTDLVSADVPAAPGVWITWTPLDMTQDALDNRSGILNMFLHFTDETAAGGEAVAFSSLENATAAQRPKLTVEYTEESALRGGGFGSDTIIRFHAGANRRF